MSLETSVACLSLACVALGWLLYMVTGWFKDMFINDSECDEIEEDDEQWRKN